MFKKNPTKSDKTETEKLEPRGRLSQTSLNMRSRHQTVLPLPLASLITTPPPPPRQPLPLIPPWAHIVYSLPLKSPRLVSPLGRITPLRAL